MIATRQMDIRANLKKYFDLAFDGEPIIVSRKQNKNVVVISEKEYNSISSENEIENSFRLLARNANKISLEQKEKFLKLLLQVQGG